MATVEIVESQQIHQTNEGVTMTRAFRTTWTEYASGNNLPFSIPYQDYTDPLYNPWPFRVGHGLSYDVLSFPVVDYLTWNLRITDILVSPINNVDIHAEILYSSLLDGANRRYEPNTNASWEEQFDIISSESSDNAYISNTNETNPTQPEPSFYLRSGHSDSSLEDWETDWIGAGGDAEKVPTNSIYQPYWVWTVRAYASELYLNRILDGLLSVNSELHWLGTYFTTLANRNGYLNGDTPGSHITDAGLITDQGRWLFTGCPIRRVAFDSWEYSFEFTFNLRWWWNYPHGIHTDKYPMRNFASFFDNMQYAPQSQLQQGARS